MEAIIKLTLMPLCGIGITEKAKLGISEKKGTLKDHRVPSLLSGCYKNYVLLCGRIVNSRTCESRLERCMESSWLRYGATSAIKSSRMSSAISSYKEWPEPWTRSAMETSSAVASRCSEERVGMAFSFSILET